MTLVTAEHHTREVEEQMFRNLATPAAATELLISSIRDELIALEDDMRRHRAETTVIIDRLEGTLEQSMADLHDVEKSLRQQLERNAAEQDRQRHAGLAKRLEVTATRADQLRELERRKQMYEAALAVGAKAVVGVDDARS